MAIDPIFQWTLLAEGSAAAETQVNELLARLAAGTVMVKADGLTAPPGTPADFDAYIVGSGATGAWSGHDAEVAVYLNGWIFFPATEGMSVQVQSGPRISFAGGAWAAIDGHQVLADAATITWSARGGTSAEVTITANRTMAAPTNVVAGRIYTLRVIQDGVGGWNITTWNAAYKFPGGGAIPITPTPAAADQLAFVADASGNMWLVGHQPDVK